LEIAGAKYFHSPDALPATQQCQCTEGLRQTSLSSEVERKDIFKTHLKLLWQRLNPAGLSRELYKEGQVSHRKSLPAVHAEPVTWNDEKMAMQPV